MKRTIKKTMRKRKEKMEKETKKKTNMVHTCRFLALFDKMLKILFTVFLN